ncbi:G patch domain-containing protein 4 [Lucilia sericata]|uniref:G patch domain-containing protein 4 n=1 Tax=Lucilia sericata TaxID=13632 RepID=UPI0018A7FBA3|nr:G patch domain-containing protein 4 [Lucilia sericata]
MDFARKILLNYGWKDGDGLGKNKDGIAKPLRATLKFDNAGFGADQAAADFNNHWWERVFNEAATNVNVQKEGEQIKMGLKDDDDGVEISTKGYSVKKLKKLKNNRSESNEMKAAYDNFLQAATLTNLGGEVENPDKIDVNDIEVSKVKVLTDEELFKACGGRTAHKGARHGLKLSGKLSRIEQQEAELLAKMLAKRNASNEDKLENNQEKSTEEKKKKKKKDKTLEAPEIDVCEEDNVNKKKKKRKHCEAIASEEAQELTNKKLKKKKNKDSELETNTIEHAVEANDDSEPLKKKKKKNKDKTLEDKVEDEVVHKKKKSKNRNKDIE